MTRRILWALCLSLIPSFALAQVCPVGSTCNPLEAYTYGVSAAGQPYGGGLRIPAAPSAAASSLQYITASTLMDLTSAQTASAKTFSSPTITGAPVFMLSSGSCTNGVALDSGGHMVTIACGGGSSPPNAALLSGNGSAFGGVTLGTNLSLTGSFPNQTLNATGGGGGTGTVPQAAFFSSTNTVTGNANVSFQSGYTAFDYNVTAPLTMPAPVAGTVARFIGLDGAATRVVADNFGAGVSHFIGQCAGGTAASPTAQTAGNCSNFASSMYAGGGAYNLGGAAVIAAAAETQGPSNAGTRLLFTTTPVASAVGAVATRLQIEPDGGIITPGVTGGSKGANTINMGGCFINNVACAAGGSGTVGSGTAPQAAYYNVTGTAIIGNPNVTFQSGYTAFDYNVTAPLTMPAPVAGTVARFIGLDGAATRVVADNFGAGVSHFIGQCAGGTAASPTAQTAGNCSNFASSMYAGGGAYNLGGAAVIAAAAETQGPSNAGTRLLFTTTPVASAVGAVATRLQIEPDGGIITPGVTGGSKGAGTINVGGCFINNVACASGGATAFSAITAGTNTSAAMVVGTGASLAVSGSGTIGATTLNGATFAAPGPIGSTTPGTGAFTTLSATTLSGTFGGTPTYSGIPIYSGLSSVTCALNVVLDSGNHLGTTGCPGSSFSATLSPGLATTATTYNPGTQTLTSGQTLSNQLFYDGHATSCTVNSTCGATNDSGKLLTATAAGVTFTMPTPGAAGTAAYNFGYDGTHTYLITTPSGTIYGNCGVAGATTESLGSGVNLVSDGTNWNCTGAVTDIFPFSWGPNQNLATTAIPLITRGIATTVTGASCTIGPTPVTGTATVVLTHGASGVAPAVGTNAIATCNAAGTANTTQTPLTLTNNVIPAGDILWIIGAGSGWAGTITATSGVFKVSMSP